MSYCVNSNGKLLFSLLVFIDVPLSIIFLLNTCRYFLLVYYFLTVQHFSDMRGDVNLGEQVPRRRVVAAQRGRVV